MLPKQEVSAGPLSFKKKVRKKKKNSGKSEPERLMIKEEEEAGVKFRVLTVQNNLESK